MDITNFRTHDDYMTPKSAWEGFRASDHNS